MNLQTFRAPTMAACLGEVKRVMGSDAVILHTRTVTLKRFFGIRRRELVEITAGRGLNGATRRGSSGPGSRGTRRPPVVVSTPPLPVVAEPGREVPDRPHDRGNRVVAPPSSDLERIAQSVEVLTRQLEQQQSPDVPSELMNEYSMLLRNKVDKKLAGEIVRNLKNSLRADHLTQRLFVRGKIIEQIERLIPTSGRIVRTKTAGPHVVALIGPTGVGKTTTVAKLAAKLKLEEKRRVGLITIDTYRIAAVEQLKKYADIIGSPLKVVGNPDEMRDAVASLRDCDFVLIDTAGRSPKDKVKLGELKTFLAAAKPDEVHLVLSTTVSKEAAEFAIAEFGNVSADKLILTKLDEAVHIGSVLDLVRGMGKPLSYVTTGQGVPEDIEVAAGRRVAELILSDEP